MNTGTPDSDIDRKVAEKVMQWKPYTRKDGEIEWCTPDPKIPVVGTVNRLALDWRPSTNIADAFLVVEEMRKRDFRFALSTGSAGKWCASFTKEVIDGDYADTAPAAICMAALEALDDRP